MTNCGSQPLPLPLDANVASIGFSNRAVMGSEVVRERGSEGAYLLREQRSSKRMPSRRIRKWRKGNRKYF